GQPFPQRTAGSDYRGSAGRGGEDVRADRVSGEHGGHLEEAGLSDWINRTSVSGGIAAAACGLLVAVGLTVEAAPAPKPAGNARVVSFQRDVKPILAHNCFACHAKGKRSGAFGMDTR